jgi:hypothetical protein
MFNKDKIEYIKSKPNILSILLERYPDKGWNLNYLSENPCAIEYIKNHPEKCWNWDLVNLNDNIDIELLRLYRDRMYRWDLFTKNHNITIDIISKNSDLPWDYSQISKNPNINVFDIENNPYIFWNFDDLSLNTNISEDFIKAHPEYNWNYANILYGDRDLSIDFISKYITNIEKSKITTRSGCFVIELLFSKLNPRVLEFVGEKFGDKFESWVWYEMSKNPYLNTTIIEKFINKNLDWYYISAINKNLKIDFIRKYIHKFDIFYLCQNPCITADFVDEHKDTETPINWYYTLKNSNIDCKYIEKYIQEKSLYRIWECISSNHGLNIDFIEKHIDKINFEQLSGNIFLYDDIVYQREVKKDIEKRRKEVKGEIKDIFYNDICAEILKFVSYH